MAKIESGRVKSRKNAPPVETTAQVPLKEQAGAPGVPTRMVGCFFGPPKTGKTTVACSGRNVLLLEFDPDGDATETLKGREDIFVLRPDSYAAVQSIVKRLYTTDQGVFDWVVVDSITFLFQVLGGPDINETYLANKDTRRPYGKAGAAVQQIVHDLVLLPDTNVIFCAHLEKEFQEEGVSMDQELGETEVKLAVTPMVWKVLGPAVSFIGRTYKRTVYEKVGKTKKPVTKFFVSFNDGSRSPAGARYPIPAQVEITDSTLTELASSILGGA